MRNVTVDVDTCGRCSMRRAAAGGCRDCERRNAAAGRLRMSLGGMSAPVNVLVQARICSGDLARIDFKVRNTDIKAYVTFNSETFPQQLICSTLDAMKEALWKSVAGPIAT